MATLNYFNRLFTPILSTFPILNDSNCLLNLPKTLLSSATLIIVYMYPTLTSLLLLPFLSGFLVVALYSDWRVSPDTFNELSAARRARGGFQTPLDIDFFIYNVSNQYYDYTGIHFNPEILISAYDSVDQWLVNVRGEVAQFQPTLAEHFQQLMLDGPTNWWLPSSVVTFLWIFLSGILFALSILLYSSASAIMFLWDYGLDFVTLVLLSVAGVLHEITLPTHPLMNALFPIETFCQISPWDVLFQVLNRFDWHHYAEFSNPEETRITVIDAYFDALVWLLSASIFFLHLVLSVLWNFFWLLLDTDAVTLLRFTTNLAEATLSVIIELACLFALLISFTASLFSCLLAVTCELLQPVFFSLQVLFYTLVVVCEFLNPLWNLSISLITYILTSLTLLAFSTARWCVISFFDGLCSFFCATLEWSLDLAYDMWAFYRLVSFALSLPHMLSREFNFQACACLVMAVITLVLVWAPVIWGWWYWNLGGKDRIEGSAGDPWSFVNWFSIYPLCVVLGVYLGISLNGSVVAMLLLIIYVFFILANDGLLGQVAKYYAYSSGSFGLFLFALFLALTSTWVLFFGVPNLLLLSIIFK